jgi:hypothetical protein
MKLGGWSLWFLTYWRCLEHILPLHITRAWDTRIREFVREHNHPLDVDALSLDAELTPFVLYPSSVSYFTSLFLIFYHY